MSATELLKISFAVVVGAGGGYILVYAVLRFVKLLMGDDK